MFFGAQHGLHYLDHFAFLHEALFGVQGAISSYYQYFTNEEFSLAFDLKLTEKMKSADDGFLLLLGVNSFRPEMLVPSDAATPAGFPNRLQKVLTPGFFMYFTGDEPGKAYVGFNAQQNVLFSKNAAQSCSFEPGSTPKFFVRLSKNTLSLSRNNPKTNDYEICWSQVLAGPWIKSFYLTMLARSAPTSNFRLDVTSLILSTDLENLGISEFEAKYDDNDHQLFRQIHFFRVNKNETERYFNTSLSDQDLKSLNLSVIHDYQTRIFNSFDYCNTLLEKNLESTDDIVTYLDQQKTAVQAYSAGMLDSMRKWINDTKFQFELMEKDTMNIVSEFKSFDLDAEFTITQNLLELLKQKFAQHADKLKNLKVYGGQIKQNLDYLKSKKAALKGLPDQIKAYLDAIEESGRATGDTFILMLLVGAGLFVLIALVAIFCRLGKNKNYASLGGL